MSASGESEPPGSGVRTPYSPVSLKIFVGPSRALLLSVAALVIGFAIHATFQYVFIAHAIGGMSPSYEYYVRDVREIESFYRPYEAALLIVWFTIVAIAAVVLQLRKVEFAADSRFRASIGQGERTAAEQTADQSVWTLARTRLDAYFARNLQQINYIFVLSVIVMLLGFAVMLVGVGFAIFVRGTERTGAFLPTVAGLITQFIGATFLFVYRSTIQQAIRYVQTLERMNTVGMAMSVLDSIKQSNSDELSDSTKASIALALLANYSGEHDGLPQLTRAATPAAGIDAVSNGG
ncbi:MAG: hypothetical protein QOF71_2816 [Candidatus Eremiobacteraeota bacterium]|jgi:hypothetical protein|nr:hypothetical protein [Candidatus Eremiobacteraeota bacterium]